MCFGSTDNAISTVYRTVQKKACYKKCATRNAIPVRLSAKIAHLHTKNANLLVNLCVQYVYCKKKTVMKNLLLILFMVIISTVTAQEGTTQEEYNYVTKGYLVTIQQGLDIKSGYTVKNASNQIKIDANSTDYIQAKYFIKTNDTKRKFACLTILYHQNNTLTKAFCLPHFKSAQEIKDLYYTDLEMANSRVKRLITITLSELLAFAYSSEKKPE